MSFKRCDISQRPTCQKRLEVSSNEAENPDSFHVIGQKKKKPDIFPDMAGEAGGFN